MWLDRFDGDLTPAGPLRSDIDADVAIVGGGFTGLWTAYYLQRRDPGLRIVVLEREVCGFGASGRNGGWCIAELAAGVDSYAAVSSHDEAMRLMRTLFASVDEVERVTAAEGIDCHFARGGAVYLARNAAQARRQQERMAAARAHGFTEDEIRDLSADEARKLVNATDIRRGIFFAPCAAIDPARLVRGLAEVVQRAGVTIHEQTPVTAIEPGRVRVDGGGEDGPVVVTAPVVVRATLRGKFSCILNSPRGWRIYINMTIRI